MHTEWNNLTRQGMPWYKGEKELVSLGQENAQPESWSLLYSPTLLWKLKSHWAECYSKCMLLGQ